MAASAPVASPVAELYQVLELNAEASLEEIRKAFKKQSLIHHPDKNQNSVESETRFKKIALAQKVLSDPQSRSVYSRWGEEGLKKLEEYHQNEAELTQQVKKSWMISVGAYLTLLIADYLFSYPLEWIAFFFSALYFIFAMAEPSSRLSSAVGLIVMTLIVYFAVPLSWLPFLAQMALFTTGLLILNTVYSFFDISLVLFVAHALVEFYVRDFGITAESASRITMLLGSFSLAMAASSLIYLNNYFNSVIVIEKWPSKLFPYFAMIRGRGSLVPLIGLGVFFPIWTLDYYTGWPFENIILSLLMIVNVAALFIDTSMDKKSAAGVLLAIVVAYIFVPAYIIDVVASVTRIGHVLAILYNMEFLEHVTKGITRPFPPWSYWVAYAFLFDIDYFYRDYPKCWYPLALIAIATSVIALHQFIFHPEEAARQIIAARQQDEADQRTHAEGQAGKTNGAEQEVAPNFDDAPADGKEEGEKIVNMENVDYAELRARTVPDGNDNGERTASEDHGDIMPD